MTIVLIDTWIVDNSSSLHISNIVVSSTYLYIGAIVSRSLIYKKRVKSDWRSSVGAVQLSRLMYVSLEGPSLASFEPLKMVGVWGPCPSAGLQPTDEELECELEAIETLLEREAAGGEGTERE